MRCRGTLWVVLVAGACTKMPAQPAPTTVECPLARAEELWMQESLRLWERASVEHLRVETPEAPWIVYFDRRCAYHLASPRRPSSDATDLGPRLSFRGRPVRVTAVAHDGRVALPDGNRVPASVHAATGVAREPPGTAFYAMALMPIWLAELPAEKRPANLSAEMLTISQHELTHTLQVLGLHRAAERLFADSKEPVRLDDDAIQRDLENDEAYVTAFRREVELLFEAAAETDRRRKKALAAEALAMARARHQRWFVGVRAPYARLDGLFLALEGPCEWVRAQIMFDARTLPRNPELAALDRFFDDYDAFRTMSRGQVIAAIRGPRPYWSQDEGLALFLTLDDLLPDWRARVFGETLPDAFDLLAEAVAAR